MDTQGVLGPQKARENGRHGRKERGQKGVLSSRGLAGRASWAPGGLPGGRLGPQRPAGRASWAPEACQQGLQGRKEADPRNCQRFQGAAQGASEHSCSEASEASEIP